MIHIRAKMQTNRLTQGTGLTKTSGNKNLMNRQKNETNQIVSKQSQQKHKHTGIPFFRGRIYLFYTAHTDHIKNELVCLPSHICDR